MCPHDRKNVAGNAELKAAKEKKAAAREPPEKEKPWGTWITRNQCRKSDPRKDKNVQPTATNPAANPATKSGGQEFSVGRFEALAIDDNQEENLMVGETSAYGKSQKTMEAKDMTSCKLEKGKQKIEEEKKTKEGMLGSKDKQWGDGKDRTGS